MLNSTGVRGSLPLGLNFKDNVWTIWKHALLFFINPWLVHANLMNQMVCFIEQSEQAMLETFKKKGQALSKNTWQVIGETSNKKHQTQPIIDGNTSLGLSLTNQ